MERFYIVTDECGYKKDYLDYEQNIKDVNEVVKEFFNENNIETSQYYVDDTQLYIVPTSKDIENFDSMLNKPIQEGLRAFKKNSKINKLFLEIIKDKDLEILSRPHVWMYIKDYLGRISTVTYMVGSEMYLKVERDTDRSITQKGFKEIKASEYYLAIESI